MQVVRLAAVLNPSHMGWQSAQPLRMSKMCRSGYCISCPPMRSKTKDFARDHIQVYILLKSEKI